MTALFTRFTRKRVVIVIDLLVPPRLDGVLDGLLRILVRPQVLSDVLRADVRLIVRRLAVFELASGRPLLTELGQLRIPSLRRRTQHRMVIGKTVALTRVRRGTRPKACCHGVERPENIYCRTCEVREVLLGWWNIARRFTYSDTSLFFD